jgi:hypothetical protein
VSLTEPFSQIGGGHGKSMTEPFSHSYVIEVGLGRGHPIRLRFFKLLI